MQYTKDIGEIFESHTMMATQKLEETQFVFPSEQAIRVFTLTVSNVDKPLSFAEKE